MQNGATSWLPRLRTADEANYLRETWTCLVLVLPALSLAVTTIVCTPIVAFFGFQLKVTVPPAAVAFRTRRRTASV